MVEVQTTYEKQLSYSSAQLLMGCEQRYYHYKIAKTPNDDDYEDDYEAFNVGKAFHQVLEKNKHTYQNLGNLIKEACTTFEVVDKLPMIHAMILTYLKTHYKSGLSCLLSEFQVIDDTFIGFIDALMVNNVTNDWYIIDLKTAAREDKFLKAKLMSDVQLNLYAGYAKKLAELNNLDLNKFQGARYRVTTKPSLKRKKGEEYSSYVSRLMESTVSQDIVIPKSIMRPFEFANWHSRLYDKTKRLREGIDQPMKNFSNCFNFFRPCPYYSKCHGVKLSEVESMLA